MNICFIGGGNMATSLIGGLLADGFDAARIVVVDVNPQRLQHLKQRFAIQTATDAQDAVSQADTVVLSVKPQVMKSVAIDLAPALRSRSVLVVSIAAGIRSTDLARWLGEDVAIVRAMPNTPALVQCAASGLFANAQVSEQQRTDAESILRATGLAIWVQDEAQMDAVTALSGSGPAYFFRIMEVLEAAGRELGLSPETARLLTLQTALGAAKLAMESSDGLVELRRGVTSPGGTTERGLQVMDKNNIDKIMHAVVNAAYRRAIELADELGEV